MVTLNQSIPKDENNQVDIQAWVDCYFGHFPAHKQNLIKNACELARLTGENRSNPYGSGCFKQGLEMAMILRQLEMDVESIAASIIASTAEYADLGSDDIEEHMGQSISQLLKGFIQLNNLGELHRSDNSQHANQLRNMLLAMVSDVRVVLLKLSERIVIMRTIKHLPDERRLSIAQETRDIYAPLANRLGISQLKWELEDLCFFYLENGLYKSLAKQISEKRIDRDKRVEDVKSFINDILSQEKINGEVSGRSKHIYSIHLKMQRKNASFQEIYDASAVRVIVDTVDECYRILSAVHDQWDYIPEEFDDYISNPKPNGYQSIHTVVIGPKDKNVEIQIRTNDMHEHAEMGVAAHWVYKEGKHGETGSYEGKIARLRQLLDWHKEIAYGDEPVETFQDTLFEDRIYVFSPAGDIIDLPVGSTPLDFAYRIHSDIGHRCRGAKVNDHMVQLTHELNTGDRVSIVTMKEPKPSRDWLNPSLGYLKTTRARAKVQHWFNSQNQEEHVQTGRETLEKESRRLNFTYKESDLKNIAERHNFKTLDGMFAALGRGSLRIAQVTSKLQKIFPEEEPITVTTHKPSETSDSEFVIQGVDNLLTHIAKCCKPIVGEPIIGYITQGHGVSIHKQNCSNIEHLNFIGKQRLIEVSWGRGKASKYQADISIYADDRTNLLRDITSILGNEKINLLAINTLTTDHKADISLTVEINSLEELSSLIDKLNNIPNVIEAKRA